MIRAIFMCCVLLGSNGADDEQLRLPGRPISRLPQISGEKQSLPDANAHVRLALQEKA